MYRESSRQHWWQPYFIDAILTWVNLHNMFFSILTGNKRCKGGTMSNAFNYVIQNKGMNPEESYPFNPKVWLYTTVETRRTEIRIHRMFCQKNGGSGILGLSERTAVDLVNRQDGWLLL